MLAKLTNIIDKIKFGFTLLLLEARNVAKFVGIKGVSDAV